MAAVAQKAEVLPKGENLEQVVEVRRVSAGASRPAAVVRTDLSHCRFPSERVQRSALHSIGGGRQHDKQSSCRAPASGHRGYPWLIALSFQPSSGMAPK